MKKEWINRFPIAAVFFKVAGDLDGRFNENESKSLGLHRAKFMAAAKFGYFGRGKENKKEKKERYERDKIKKINFAGQVTWVVERNGEIRGYLGGVIEPEEYNRYIIKKIEQNSFEGAYNIIEELVKKELEGINPNSEQVYKKYVKNRDKFRTFEFLEMMKKKVA